MVENISKNSNNIFFQILSKLASWLRGEYSVVGTTVAGAMSWGSLWLVNYDGDAKNAVKGVIVAASKVTACVAAIVASFFTWGGMSVVAGSVCGAVVATFDMQKAVRAADALATLKTGTDFFQTAVVDPVANTAQWLAVNAPPLFAALAIFVSFIELAPAMIRELSFNMGWGKHSRWWMMARREQAAAELVLEATEKVSEKSISYKAAEKATSDVDSDAETEAPDDDDNLDESDAESEHDDINIEALANIEDQDVLREKMNALSENLEKRAKNLEEDAGSLAGLLDPESKEVDA